MSSTISVTSGDGRPFEAYLALPDNPSYHAETAQLSEERALKVFDTMKEPALA